MNKTNDYNSQAAYQHRMQLVLDYIENHLDDSLSLESLSQQANFSPFHFRTRPLLHIHHLNNHACLSKIYPSTLTRSLLDR